MLDLLSYYLAIMSLLKKHLKYSESDDSFLWKSSPEDLQKFVNAILDIEDDSKGELKEDKKHDAFTYKLNDISVRFYITTGTLKLFGMGQNTLLNNLHKIIDENKVSPVIPSSMNIIKNGCEDEAEDEFQPLKPHEASPGSVDDSVILCSQSNIDTGENVQMNTESIFRDAVMSELKDLRNEVEKIKAYSCTQGKQVNHSPVQCQCYKEIDELKNRENIKKEYIKKLEEEKASLVTVIKLLMTNNEPTSVKCNDVLQSVNTAGKSPVDNEDENIVNSEANKEDIKSKKKNVNIKIRNRKSTTRVNKNQTMQNLIVFSKENHRSIQSIRIEILPS